MSFDIAVHAGVIVAGGGVMSPLVLVCVENVFRWKSFLQKYKISTWKSIILRVFRGQLKFSAPINFCLSEILRIAILCPVLFQPMSPLPVQFGFCMAVVDSDVHHWLEGQNFYCVFGFAIGRLLLRHHGLGFSHKLEADVLAN